MSAVERVGLNALFLDPGVSGGPETYVRQLSRALVAAFPSVHFELATTRRGAQVLAADGWGDLVRLHELPCDDDQPVRRTLVELFALPRLARERRWDVVHSLANRGPRRAGTASVLTLHDVIFFHHRTFGLVSTYGMRWAVRAAARGADALIAGSVAAADDVAATLGIDSELITPIPHGPGREVGEPAPLPAVRERFGILDGPMVVCVAAKRPHKNQRLLVEALPLLPANAQLVLVGHDEGYGAELRSTAAELGVDDRIRLVEGVSGAELEALWALADCAAFPTRAEGFGLPVLEGMRRGVPVACSDIPVLREVAGNAAQLFDPDDPAAAAAAIAAAMEDDSAAARGRERAARFTWERTAAATFEVYERAVALRGQRRR
jgi:glycosyltransferase involved in cell wall biosynthesis